MKMLMALAVAGVLMLAGCSGGSKTASMSGPPPPPTPTIGGIEQFDVRVKNVIPVRGSRNGLSIRGGNVPSHLLEYLDEATSYLRSGERIYRPPIPYKAVIRYQSGWGDFWNTVAAELNKVFPDNYRITTEVDERTLQPSSYSTLSEFYSVAIDGVPEGRVVVVPGSRLTFRNWGLHKGVVTGSPRRKVLLLREDESNNVSFGLHEMYHALGFPGHVIDGSSILDNSLKRENLLTRRDRDALRAVYSWGDWSQRPVVMGETGDGTVFGVTGEANGAVPWAYGRRSQGLLRDAVSQVGFVSWEGSVIGFTDDRKRVSGNVELEVDVATAYTSQHDLMFDGIRVWEGPDITPATDPLWNGDGRLDYKVSLEGSRFKRVGGDDGVINGQFFGDIYNDMGGTLNRNDLTAAFGGSR